MSRRDRKDDVDGPKDTVDENNHVSDEIKKYNKRLFEKRDKKLFIAGAVIIAFLIGFFISPGAMTGFVVANDLGSGVVGEKVVDFINENLVSGEDMVTLEAVMEASGLYIISTTYQGSQITVYSTMDGRYLIFDSGIVDMNEYLNPDDGGDQGTVVPKTSRPVVELFIWSYCPYGVQAQGPLAEVASLLGSKADFSAILYYDGHGAYETQENKIQACIQKLEPEKYWDYAAGFVENIYPVCGQSRDIDCDKTKAIELMDSLGIDSIAVMSCVESEGEALIADDYDYAGELGVTGSPTVVINGVKVSVARNADALKQAVCDAFTNPPEECSTSLSTSGSTSSGGC